MPTPYRVALATCTQIPGLDADDRLLIDPLAARGAEVVPAVWDDPGVDWDAFDLVVIRSTWDYPTRRAEFTAWAESVPRLANPAGMIAWNTDKRYLEDLAAAGVAVVSTDWYDPGERPRLAERGVWVVKPTVGAGSQDTERYDLTSPQQRALAGAHVARLHAAGRAAMAQPYLTAVDTHGETALVYIDGRFSHAARKGAMLGGRDLDASGLYVSEDIRPREAGAAERAVADAVLAALPLDGTPLYARVDLIPDDEGVPTLLELELAEPSLFLGYAAGAADRMAEAIAVRLRHSRR